jgi:basic membrane protein A and related proteins
VTSSQSGRQATASITILGVLLVLVAVFAANGCGRSTPASSTSSSPVSIKDLAIVTPEKANDFGWNQQGVAALKAAAKPYKAAVTVQDGVGYGDIAPILRRLAADHPAAIFAWASGYGSVAPNVARTTRTPMVIVGASDSANVPGLVQNTQTNAQLGAYQAGVLAGKTTKTGTVAIVVSADDENWVKMSGGFIAGARAARPGIHILYVQIGQGAYADAAGGKRVTQSAIKGGADVIFGMGDGSSFGMLQACETATPPAGASKVWFIDVIGDKSSLDQQGVYLSSVVWDYEPVFAAALRGLQDGTFGRRTLYLDPPDGLRLLHTKWIPDEIWSAVQKARRDIADGSVKVPLTTSEAEVQQLLAQ